MTGRRQPDPSSQREFLQARSLAAWFWSAALRLRKTRMRRRPLFRQPRQPSAQHPRVVEGARRRRGRQSLWQAVEIQKHVVRRDVEWPRLRAAR